MNLTHTSWKDALVPLPVRRLPGALVLLLGALPATAQHQEWIRQLGTSGFESAHSAASDGAGGVFVSGSTGGSLGGPSAGSWDVWIARYRVNGTQLWIRQFGTRRLENVDAAAPDGAGGVYVGGQTTGNLGGTLAGERDVWLAHYDGAGNQLWVRQLGTIAIEGLSDAVSDTAGGVFVVGGTGGALGGPSAGGSNDAWLARYDGAGNQLWIRQFGTMGDEAVGAAAADGTGGLFIGGFTSGALGGPLVGATDAWLARYDRAGNELWIRQFGTRYQEGIYSAALDTAGGVYVGGQTWGAFGGPLVGATDAWFAHYDGVGNRLWIRQLGSSQHESANVASPDGEGGLYIGGTTYGSLVMPITDYADAWFARYDSGGNQLWIRQFGTITYTGLNAAAPDMAGGVYLVGETDGNLGGPIAGNWDGWVARWDGPCFNLDFETEDDFTTPLGNGQKIDAEFGRLVRISGAGANAGPTTFDTTPGGPNDPALNDDMLIGHGNVLLLEDDWYSFAQTVPGFFDVVTDDPHGGDLIFDFLQPVDPRSVLLADINPPTNLGASVTLTDGHGQARVYTVEPGWTGGYGNAGPWQLDLTTTVPQPGNGTPRFATAIEDPGFVQANVVQMVVHLTGSGAIDELSLCLAHASTTLRNGSGRNPTILGSSSLPVLGSTWSAELDCSAYGSGLATLVSCN